MDEPEEPPKGCIEYCGACIFSCVKCIWKLTCKCLEDDWLCCGCCNCCNDDFGQNETLKSAMIFNIVALVFALIGFGTRSWIKSDDFNSGLVEIEIGDEVHWLDDLDGDLYEDLASAGKAAIVCGVFGVTFLTLVTIFILMIAKRCVHPQNINAHAAPVTSSLLAMACLFLGLALYTFLRPSLEDGRSYGYSFYFYTFGCVFLLPISSCLVACSARVKHPAENEENEERKEKEPEEELNGCCPCWQEPTELEMGEASCLPTMPSFSPF